MNLKQIKWDFEHGVLLSKSTIREVIAAAEKAEAIRIAGQNMADVCGEHVRRFDEGYPRTKISKARIEEARDAWYAATGEVQICATALCAPFPGMGEPMSADDIATFNAALEQYEAPAEAPLPRAEKIGGSYQAEGTIVSTFTTLAGETRHVFEFDQPKGMLHIFGPSQVHIKGAAQ